MPALFVRCASCSSDQEPTRINVRPRDARHVLTSRDVRVVVGVLDCAECREWTVVHLEPWQGLDRRILRAIAGEASA